MCNREFNVGDRVSFTPGSEPYEEGTVDGTLEDDGGFWYTIEGDSGSGYCRKPHELERL
jgi:hypothetical protein